MGEFSTSLVGGYAVNGFNSQTIVIVPPEKFRFEPSNCAGTIAIAAKVQKYAECGQFIVGVVESAPRSELFDEQRVGHFIIDTETGKVYAGLDQESWEGLLRERGLPNNPHMRAP